MDCEARGVAWAEERQRKKNIPRRQLPAGEVVWLTGAPTWRDGVEGRFHFGRHPPCPPLLRGGAIGGAMVLAARVSLAARVPLAVRGARASVVEVHSVEVRSQLS